jgi:hypothetical protein
MNDFFYVMTWSYVTGLAIVLLYKFIRDTED